MKKVNLFEELINERSKQITSEELRTAIKSIWSKDDQIKKHIIATKKFKPLLYKESKIKFGLGDKQLETFINSENIIITINYKSKQWLMLDSQLESCKKEVLDILKSNKDEYNIGFSKSLILQRTNGDEKFIDYLLEILEKKDEIYKKDEEWILKGVEIILNDSDELLKTNLINILDERGFTTPSLD